ncbi:hypothetical protein D3C73_1225470 [compost metagenome]
MEAESSELYALNFTGFQGTGAYVYTLRFAIHQNANLLNVNSPRATVAVVGMGYVVTAARFLASYSTFTGHHYTSLLLSPAIKQYLTIISQ